LLKSGADVNQKTNGSNPPLFYAFDSNDEKVINILLDHPGNKSFLSFI